MDVRTIRRLMLPLVLMLTACPPVKAQFTTVSGTITDPNGVIYQNGQWHANLIVPAGANCLPLFGLNGLVAPTEASGSLDSFGSFTSPIADNSQIGVCGVLGTTQWNFNFTGGPVNTPNGKVNFFLLITISGATQSITAAAHAAAAPLQIGFGTGGVITAPAFISSSPNPATLGVLRLAQPDAIAWRTTNLAGNGPTLSNAGAVNGTIPADTLTVGNSGVIAQFFGFSNPSVANNGTFRLTSTGTMEWRNNAGGPPNTFDVVLAKDTNDNLTWPNGIIAASYSSSAANTAVGGTVRMPSNGSVTWRNNASNADVALAKDTGDNLTWPNAVVAASFRSSASVFTTAYPIHLATADYIVWENAASSGFVVLRDFGAPIGNFPADLIQITGGGGFLGTFVSDFSTSPATSGKLRLASPDAIAWRNTANNADAALSKNASDNLVWPNGLSLGGGSTINLYKTVTDTPGNITVNAGTCTDRSVALAGSGTGATISVAANYALEANIVIGPAQAVAGTVHYRICNVTGANITLNAASTFNLAVIQ